MSFLSSLLAGLKSEKQAPSNSAIVRQSFMAQAPNRDIGAFLKAYSENEWLNAAITLIADKMAEQKIRLYRKVGQGEKQITQEVFDHPALKILEDPNPIQGKSGLMSHLIAQNELVGNAYLLLIRGERTGRPLELWTLDPRFVSIKWNIDGTIEYYKYQIDGKTEKFDPKDVLHFKLPNPQSIYFGVSPAQSAAVSIDTDIYSLKWWRNFFFNSARPDFLLLFKKIAKDARDRLERKFNQKFRGVNNSHKMAVLEQTEGMELHEFSKPDDSSMSVGADARRDRILAAYRVPRDLIGLGQNSNLASIQSSIYIFSNYTLKPKLQRFVEQLNREFLSLFPNSENLFFDFDDPTPENQEEKNRLVESGLQNGYLTINEARQEQGFSPIEGGDVLLVSFQKVPLGDVIDGADLKAISAPQKKKIKPKKITEKGKEKLKAQHLRRHARLEKRFLDEMEKFFEKQRKEVLKDLKDGGLKGAKELNPLTPLEAQKWINELVLGTTPIYELIVESGGDDAALLVGGGAVFNFNVPAVRSFISEMAFKFSSEINETTQKQLRKTLIEAQEAGEGIDKITDRVDEIFNVAKRSRARLIARTETTKAFNGGARESYQQLGVKTYEWLATEDARTRPTHAKADGQRRPEGVPFDVGNSKLLYPGDPNGSVEEVANCRCTILPIVD